MVYDQFDKAFSNVTAYALIYAGKPVGRVALKHGAAVTAYVQVWGVEMTKGRATGGGYDRATAAVESAVHTMRGLKVSRDDLTAMHALNALIASQDGADGSRWTSRLERCGFTLALVIG